jgi:hypothetical protein
VIGDTITDVGCSLKVYRSRYLTEVPVFDGVHRFLPGMCALAGARVGELPVAHRPRRHGRAKYGVRNRLWRGLRDLLGVRWLQSRWLNPGDVVEIESTAAAAGRINTQRRDGPAAARRDRSHRASSGPSGRARRKASTPSG